MKLWILILIYFGFVLGFHLAVNQQFFLNRLFHENHILFECLNDLQLKYKGNFYINQTFSQGFFPIR